MRLAWHQHEVNEPGCGSVANLAGAGEMVRMRSGRVMSDFKGRHFEGEIVLWAVRW